MLNESKEILKRRKEEIRCQWECYKETKGKSLPPEDFKVLKEQAKKYGVILK